MVLVSLLLASVTLACGEDNVPPTMGAFMQVFPSDRAQNVTKTPVLEWTKATGADTYTVIVSRDADFTHEVFRIEGLSALQIPLGPVLEDGFRYYWKVLAINSGASLPAANAGATFRVAIGPPSPSPDVTRYYVSTSGEDNPDCGTLEKPFRSLSYAASRVPPNEGDVIEIGPGTFVESEPALIPPGVNVLGAGEDKTILASSGVTVPASVNPSASDYHLWFDGSLIQLVSPHKKTPRSPNSESYAPVNGNQTISGFTIDGAGKKLKAGVWVENRNNVTMHHVTFRDIMLRGAVFAPGVKNWYTYPEFYMTGILIHDCTFVNCSKDLPDQSLGNLNIAQLDGAEIYNITINESEGYGIKFIYDGYFKNVNIHDCVIDVNESDAKWGEDIAIELWNIGPGNRISNITCNTWLSIANHPEMFGQPGGVSHLKIQNIIMKDLDGNSGKEAIEVAAPGVEVANSYFENKGIGIAIWDMGRSEITIRNNIFYNSSVKNNWASGAAVYIDNSRNWTFRDIHIHNNVFDTHAVTVKIKGLSIQDIDIRNNAFINTVSADVEAVGTNIMATNNLKFTAGNSPWVLTGVTSVANNIMGNPGYFFTGIREGNYYKPIDAHSLVVDRGIDVGLGYSGSSPDIGYAEFLQ